MTATGCSSRSLGIGDAIANWFYGHNILGLWFTTNGIGLAYFCPRSLRNPLYSHLLSIVGFDHRHTLHAHRHPPPAAEPGARVGWKAVAVISSVMLLVPVMSVLVNFLTMKGKWPMIATPPAAALLLITARASTC